jgi:hypothetical protein
MSGMKRELERLADIVIWGNLETMMREFQKVENLANGTGIRVMANAVEMARQMTPLCECGEDYHARLFERFPSYPYEIDKESADNA